MLPKLFARRFSASIDANKLTVLRTTSPKLKLPNEKLVFGGSTSDHILEVDWSEENGWEAPSIKPYQKFSIDPAASVFHYGLCAFEGMKAYRDASNNSKIRLFRPELNMARLNKSMARLAFPNFEGESFLKCIEELVRIEEPWIPKGEGFSLYIRPTVISTYPYVGVTPSKQIKLYVICCPVGPYYASGFKAVKLLADPARIRAWPGGTGNTKVGANYAIGIMPQKAAAAKGFAQLLWLFGPNHEITEGGTMNQFFFWRLPNGKKELVTPPLDGTILEGVTRSSVLSLARQWGEFEVSERIINMNDVTSAIKEGRMLEAFGAGTAAIVTSVESIHYDGVDYPIPVDPISKQNIGPLAKRFMDTLLDIQYGRAASPWSRLIN